MKLTNSNLKVHATTYLHNAIIASAEDGIQHRYPGNRLKVNAVVVRPPDIAVDVQKLQPHV